MSKPIRPSLQAHKVAGMGLSLLLTFAMSAESTAALSLSPEDSVHSFYDTLLTTMKGGPTLGQSGRYARLAPVVMRLFDISLMARLAVGPSWATLSPAQQQQVTEAFGHYIAATYADRFDSYSGEQLQVIGEQPYATEVIVQTRIVKSTGDTVNLNYRMRQNGSCWQIADVYLDGSISQLATQRSEFHSILQREGADGLIMALNRKVDLLTRNLAAAS
ncbi:MAG TPA: ABC transporter substrate-binding protein [Stellaceae bacterium]|jgi:phospholipid transport system substrate-binding protein|nr:ABC transporter substrate-binding protein [Stellaceae bacterium]